MEINTYETHASLKGNPSGIAQVLVEAPEGAYITGGCGWAAFHTEVEQVAPFFPAVGAWPHSTNIWTFAFQVPSVPTDENLIRAHCYVVAVSDLPE